MGILRTAKHLGRAGAIALIAGLAGCIQTPALLVTPLALNIESNQQASTFRITNIGAGTLEWTVTESLPWLTVRQGEDAGADSIAGTTIGSEIDVIELLVDRSNLPLGISRGEITIASNGGTQVINVSVVESRPALLQVSESQIDFGPTATDSVLFVSNGGVDPLNWSLTISPDAPWLKATPTGGTLGTAGEFESVKLTVDREDLAANTFTGTITVTSNGGTEVVGVSMIVPPFSVTPDSLDFGIIDAPASASLTLVSNSFSDIPVSIATSTNTGGGWLSAAPATGTVPSAGNFGTTVTVDPTGLPPGDYTGTVSATNTIDGFTISVPVSISINQLVLSPTLIDFGDNQAISTDTIQIQNLDPSEIQYTVTIPPAAAWLDVDPRSGTVTTTADLLVTIDRGAVGPGEFEADVTVSFPGGSAVTTIRMTNPKPAELKFEPNQIDLGATRNSELVGVWNDGIGVVDYRIDTTDFPDWLSISPSGVAGIITGTVQGAQTDAYTIRVDRSLGTPGQVEFEHTFTAEASGDASNDIPVTVKMLSPLIPELTVIADGEDINGVDFVSFDVDQGTRTFVIRNTGTGTLQWEIDTTRLPTWITSVQPASASIDADTQRTVTIAVDRADLTFQGAQHTLTITSNDPEAESVPLNVEVLVEAVPAIGTVPSTISFGLTDISSILAVANTGDPETRLNYRIQPSKEWLSVFPDTGSSIGTDSPIKDFQEHNVTVDRALLGGSGSSAVLTIEAFAIENGEPVPRNDVEPVEVDVSVEAAQLTFETARPRLRIPSLVRFVLLMRNLNFDALPLPESRLDEVAQLLAVFENDVPLEDDETNKFMQPISRARTNALILLDYSGSMRDAASKVTDPDIAGAADPIQALYERTVSTLIDELPDSYKIGLAVFNDRATGAFRPIYGGPGEPANIQDELFIRDEDALIQRLNDIVVLDNGATALPVAVREAVKAFVDEDLRRNLIPFDDADVRALIAVTDGRLTTPPGVINDIIEPLVTSRTRFLCVGWGEDVNSNFLVRLATESGGHFYATRTEPTGAVDAFGNSIRRPVVAELEDWVTTDPLDRCDQSIAKDLESQVIFSYVTLNEGANVNFEGRLTFNDPNDQNDPNEPVVCLEEQGEISGTFAVSQLNFEEIAGDPRLGQISLFSEGVQPDGTAEILVRLEGTPRNITEFSFTMTTANAAPLTQGDVVQVTSPQGGVIDDWTRSGGGDVYTFNAPAGDPLQYGEFGNLLRVSVSGIVGGIFRLNFDVLAPTIGFNDPNSKYITYPDSITLDEEEFVATAFPNPFIGGTPAPFRDEDNLLAFDLGDSISVFNVNLFNLGGAHSPTNVVLQWELFFGTNGGLLSLVPGDAPTMGALASTFDTDTITLEVDRTADPGDYIADFNFDYIYGSLGLEFSGNPIRVFYTVTQPNLAVSTNALNFGAFDNDLQLLISNTGQSILNWDIANFFDFPIWLDITQTLGTLVNDDSDAVRVRVDRTQVPAGNYTFPIQINGDNGQTQTVTVNMTVP